MSSNRHQAGGKRRMKPLPTIRRISASCHYRNQKPSRPTQIVVSKRASGDSPKAISQTRGFVQSTKRRARLLAKVYEVDPLVCSGRMGEQAAQRPASPKYGSETKVIAVILGTEEIRRILAHLVKIRRGRPATNPAILLTRKITTATSRPPEDIDGVHGKRE